MRGGNEQRHGEMIHNHANLCLGAVFAGCRHGSRDPGLRSYSYHRNTPRARAARQKLLCAFFALLVFSGGCSLFPKNITQSYSNPHMTKEEAIQYINSQPIYSPMTVRNFHADEDQLQFEEVTPSIRDGMWWTVIAPRHVAFSDIHAIEVSGIIGFSVYLTFTLQCSHGSVKFMWNGLGPYEAPPTDAVHRFLSSLLALCPNVK